jgi:hypothetical protein
MSETAPIHRKKHENRERRMKMKDARIRQTICQPLAGKSSSWISSARETADFTAIRQPPAAEFAPTSILQPAARESGERLVVDFSKHYHLLQEEEQAQ